jgi:hypothetical protein
MSGNTVDNCNLRADYKNKDDDDDDDGGGSADDEVDNNNNNSNNMQFNVEYTSHGVGM